MDAPDSGCSGLPEVPQGYVGPGETTDTEGGSEMTIREKVIWLDKNRPDLRNAQIEAVEIVDKAAYQILCPYIRDPGPFSTFDEPPEAERGALEILRHAKKYLHETLLAAVPNA